MTDADGQNGEEAGRGSGGSTLRSLAIPLAILIVGIPLGIWAVSAMSGDSEDDDGFTPISEEGQARERVAEARWEPVRSIEGSGDDSRSFEISEDAIQWQATWSCRSGEVQMSFDSDSDETEQLADESCPGDGSETWTTTGSRTLAVSASGPWRVLIEQQIDTPLEEPPLPGMNEQNLVARGAVHPVERDGEGTISLYELPDGRLALRFEDFYTAGSPGLEVWLSDTEDVESTLQAREAPYVNAGSLRSTLGSYNQVLPAEARTDRIGTITIWCPLITIPFAAAPLRDA